MMHPIAFILPVILTFIIFLIPPKIHAYYAVTLTFIIAAITSVAAVAGFQETFSLEAGIGGANLTFTIDKLSALFILVTNFTAVTGMLVSGAMLKSYGKAPVQNALHYFSYSWLHLSMLALLMLRNGLSFLIAWELMAVSSFMLILFDAEKREILKTAVSYMVQMHIGLLILIVALLMVWKATGNMSFDALPEYFAKYSNAPLFLLFFAGFAMKAGFIPFHTWLPEAHPAAPSHVSGFMSGVMIKMGIYGIFRVIVNMQSDLYSMGITVLLISSVTAVFGILLSVFQKDMKRLLAYCSIENIGIIGIGTGIGMAGLGSGNHMMALLGFTGAFLHVINHSLVKSLLFFSTGAFYMRYHTRNLEELGGIIRKMPGTAVMFLIGTLAICGLPPMNTFISELLLFSGMFTGLTSGDPWQSILMLAGIIALALAGGLAIFAFSKAFGVAFLGEPRTSIHPLAPSLPARRGLGEDIILIPQILIAMLILLIGLSPVIFLKPLMGIVAFYFPATDPSLLLPITAVFSKISLTAGMLIFIVLLIIILRKIITNKKIVTYGPTWGCGYSAGSAKMQYTATSFSSNMAELANPVVPGDEEYQTLPVNEIFPSARTFTSARTDFLKKLTGIVTDRSMFVLKYLARLQTGHIQHYILYAFVFIVFIFLLIYLGAI